MSPNGGGPAGPRSPFRRVVTGTGADGRSRAGIVDTVPVETFGASGPLEKVVWAADVWRTAGHPPDPAAADQAGIWRLEPSPGGATFRIVGFPPRSAGSELHRTETIDFAVVLSGEVWLVLESGEVRLRPHDCIVQRATVHAWQNRGDEPCLLCAVMLSTRGGEPRGLLTARPPAASVPSRNSLGQSISVSGPAPSTSPSVPPPGSGRLAQYAYERVRGQVLRGALAAGAVLNEGVLARELAISKTPVRQALRALLQEGLLEVGPRRQMVVRGVSRDHRRELLEIREALERISVGHACQSIHVDDVDYLRILIRRQRRAADAGDEEAFIELDEELHLRIAAASDLHLVPKFLSQLRGFVRLMRLGSKRYPGHLYRVIEEHEAIVDALERRDQTAALSALHVHLHTTDYVLETEATPRLGPSRQGGRRPGTTDRATASRRESWTVSPRSEEG
jgi:DNA-binding GntR family transcriptional regulator/quercetin dioxygenase-like cupin family protein